MLDILANIYDEGGRLVGVTYTLFNGDPRFVTAVNLRFESVSAGFRAVADDDTLTVNLGDPIPEKEETVIEKGNSPPWSDCLGMEICWAWRMTNHQGYSDGVRLEFGEPGEVSRAVVELLVFASAIHVFVALPGGAA